MVDINIRLAGTDDIDSLLDMMALFYVESGYPLNRVKAGAAFKQLLSNPDLGRVWIAEQESDPLAYIVLTLGFSMEYEGRDSFIDDLYVRKQARGKGIASALFDTLLNTCKELDVKAIHLEVERTNDKAKALYSSRGFWENDRQLLSRRLN